ncbi:MAG: glutamate 5-kinase [Chloroflexota bacterium]
MSYRRIVAKLGTSLLTAGTERLNLQVMSSLVEQVATLHHQGKEVVIVSSGAVAAGRQKLGSAAVKAMEHRSVPFKQVLASIGQSRLMHAYEQLFGWHNITVAQALLTRSALAERAGYLNARNTLLSLIDLRVVCIINENDVVAAEELEGVAFGDNDNLSAMVANLVDADLLVLLTNIDGLYTADPHSEPGARLVQRVDSIDESVERLAGGAGDQGTGGMATKIEAAKLATASGIAVVIANGYTSNALLRIASGEDLGTLFPPRADKMESRKRWLACGLDARGSVIVDDGAVRALKKQNRSLLPAGIQGVEGEFQRGDLVYICDARGKRLACGISNYSSRDVMAIKGSRSDSIAATLGYEYGSEVVHRNDLALL